MELKIQVAQHISKRARRITANNPGFFTGPGTNTYLLGGKKVIVVDPGPAIEDHYNTIINATKKIEAIIVTHTHLDHSPAAKLLGDRLGIPIYGLKSNQPYQDRSFNPTSSLHDGQIFETSECTLRVIHTPGHAENHICLLLIEENLLLSGDHIMQGSTVVIRPPDGNMRHYLSSLKKLKHFEISNIAPGHGNIINTPKETIEWIISHRIDRENKILNCLKTLGERDLDSLTPSVYDDIDLSLHRFAKWSLEAHLIKLVEDKVVAINQNKYYIP